MSNARQEVKTFNHAFTVGFSVPGSTTSDGSDITREKYANALLQRIVELNEGDEWGEAVGAPFDTYEEESASSASPDTLQRIEDYAQDAVDRMGVDDLMNVVKDSITERLEAVSEADALKEIEEHEAEA